MEPKFYDGKKVVLMIKKNLEMNRMICINLQCFMRKDTIFSPYDLAFLLIKKKYKAKLSTRSILKKKINKNNFGKKTS